MAPPSKAAPKMTMTFSTVPVAAAPLLGGKAPDGPLAPEGPDAWEAGAGALGVEDGDEAELGVLAGGDEEGVEAGGDGVGEFPGSAFGASVLGDSAFDLAFAIQAELNNPTIKTKKTSALNRPILCAGCSR